MEEQTLFIFVTAAGVSRDVGELVRGAIGLGWGVYTAATPNVAAVTPPAQLLDIPGSTWISDYGRPPLDRFPFGTMLVAPCTFNTLNKLAHGIADSLVAAMVADALGAGCPILIAPAMNRGLWNHPQTSESLQRLERWSCTIVPPQVSETEVTMASIETILHHVESSKRSHRQLRS